MPLPTFATRDEIPEPFRDLYAEQDGQWVATLPDDSGAVSALQKERERAKAEERARKEKERELADLRRQLEAKATGASDEKIAELLRKFDADRAALEAEYQAKLQDRDAKLATLTLKEQVERVALAQGIRGDRLTQTMALVRDRIHVSPDAERPVVLDAKGQPTTATVEEFFAKTFRGEMPEFYSPSGASGAGAGGSTAPGGGTATGSADALERKRRSGAYGSTF